MRKFGHDTIKNSNTVPKKHEFFDVAVLGLGFSGAFTADELSTAGMRVVAIDANTTVLGNKSTSRNECFKLHTGVHYVGHLKTATNCLRNSVRVAHYFGDLILDKDNPKAPSRRGRHYLMSNSLFSPEHVKSVCNNLKMEYKRLLKKFPKAKKIFGEPSNFIRYLNRSDYSYVADEIEFIDEQKKAVSTQVILGIETPECQINFKAFRAYFENIFIHHSNKHGLTLRLGHKVKQLNFDESASGYVIKTNYFDNKTKQYRSQMTKARCVINCTWNNIELLNKQLGFFYEGDRINRIKVMIRVPLLPSLQKMNTCIFFVGPHASITNIYDKKGKHQAILTYEPVTNVGYYKCGTPLHRRPQYLRQLETEKLYPKKGIGRKLSQKILEGVARYIPAFQWGEKPTEVSIGYVKNCFLPKSDYLYRRDSNHHHCTEKGLEVYDIGFIAFSGMKMTYVPSVSEEITQLARYHLFVQKLLKVIIITAYEKLKLSSIAHDVCLKAIKSTLLFHMRRDAMTRLHIDINDPQQFPLKSVKNLLHALMRNATSDNEMIQKLVHDYKKALATSYHHTRLFRSYISKVHSVPVNKLTSLEQRFKNNSSPKDCKN